jgi:hypothetical protein
MALGIMGCMFLAIPVAILASIFWIMGTTAMVVVIGVFTVFCFVLVLGMTIEIFWSDRFS